MRRQAAPRPDLTDIGSGRPLVFLHGWAVDRTFFSAQSALTAKGFRVLAPDLPGHGDRPLAGASPTMAGLAETLGALLDGLRSPVLVGWSMGAMVALEHIARSGGAGLAGLVIVDMSPKVANADDWPLGLTGGQDLAGVLAAADRMESAWSDYAPRIAEALFAPGRESGIGRAADAAARIAARDPAIMAALWRSLVQADHRATIRSLSVPLLAVAGAESRLYAPDVGAWMAATAPRGETVTIAQAGHAPHVEDPVAFNTALARFADAL